MKEEWKPAKGFEELYEVSSFGRVRSLSYRGSGIVRILKPQKLTNGYLQVSLYKDRKQHSELIHRLVAKTFIPNPSWLPMVNHLDEDKTNNSADNLEWCTNEYNVNYGTSIAKRCKPLVAKDSNGNIIHRFKSTREASDAGFNLGHVSSCCSGRLKTHKGFYWEYI